MSVRIQLGGRGREGGGEGGGGGTSWKGLKRQTSRPGASCRAAVCTRHHAVHTSGLQELQRFGGARHTSTHRLKKKRGKKTVQCQDLFHRKKMKKKKRKEKKKAGCSSPAEEAGGWALCSHSCNQSVTSELGSTSTQKGAKQELLGVLRRLTASGSYLFFGL